MPHEHPGGVAKVLCGPFISQRRPSDRIRDQVGDRFYVYAVSLVEGFVIRFVYSGICARAVPLSFI